MKIVRIKESTIKEALERVKRELGPDAVVVSTRTVWEREGLKKKRYFEVAAAVEKEECTRLSSEQLSTSSSASFSNDLMSEIINLSVELQRFRENWDRAYIQAFSEIRERVEGLETNVARLYDSLHEMARALDRVANGIIPTFAKNDETKEKVLKDIYGKLWESGFHPSIIHKWLKSLAENLENSDSAANSKKIEHQSLEFIAKKLIELVPPCEPARIHNFRRLALIGPTGSGKTTTLAKLILDWFEQGMRPQIVFWKRPDSLSLDTLLKPFGISTSMIKSWEELKRALSNSNMPTIVDLYGVSPRYKSDFERLNDMCALLDLEAHLCLPAYISLSEAKWLIKEFEQCNPNSILITKLDECRSPSGILQGISEHNLPLSIFTTGKDIPGNFEVATPERLAAMVLGLST